MITKNCLNCNNEFRTRQSDVNRGHGKFCSTKCSSIYAHANKPAKKPNCICSTCNKEMYKKPSALKTKSGHVFCSRKCKEEAQRINNSKSIPEIQPPHYGDGNGIHTYRKLALEEYEHHCNRCGYSKIPQILQVHHIDRNRQNNLIENLEILCPNCHQEDHYHSKDGLWSGSGALGNRTR